jgi:hypothetical protein
MPVSLSASELAMIERGAAPLDRNRRDAFIEAVLAALKPSILNKASNSTRHCR